MTTEARAALELSKEGRSFLELVTKCSDPTLVASLVEAGAKLLTVGASGKENVLSAPAAPDLSSALLSLKALSLINPRGRFDLTFAKEALCLTGAKVNIVIPTTLLTHVAILDHIPQDTKKRCLVFLVLDRNGPAVMNGKQRLEVAIVQTLESDTVSVRSSAGELLEGHVAAVLCQAVGMCIPNFTNFLAPDTEVYKSSRGQVGVSAVVKANPGHLYPLPGALLFAERPTLFVSHCDVMAVEYRRTESVTFDLVLHVRPPGREARGETASGSVQQVEFSQIDRAELGRLQSYFAASRIKPYDPAAPPRLGAGPSAPAGAGGAGPSTGAAPMDADDDDDDEDEDEDDEDFDPSALERLETGRRPPKRARTEPSGSVAASNLPGAGPGSSRAAAGMEEEVEGGSGDAEDEEEGDSDDESGGDSEEEEEEEEEDELADLTDEEDLLADDVRQRVGRAGGAGKRGGGAGAAAAGKAGGSGSAHRRRSQDEEEEEEDYSDDDDDDE